MRPAQPFHLFHLSHKFYEFHTVHGIYEGNLSRKISDRLLYSVRLFKTVHPLNGQTAPVRPDKSHKLPDRRRLAGSVWAKKSKNLSLFHRKADIKYAPPFPVVFCYIVDLNHAHSDIPPYTRAF